MTVDFICNERGIRSSQCNNRYISWNDNSIHTYTGDKERLKVRSVLARMKEGCLSGGYVVTISPLFSDLKTC